MSFSKPLIISNGQHLPFKDRSFEYVIALHVLEHASDPSQFAAEMARVAAAGFVQVPSRASEQAFGWPYHPWLIDQRGQVLVFEPRGDLVSLGPARCFTRASARARASGCGSAPTGPGGTTRCLGSPRSTSKSRARAQAPHTAEFDLQATLDALNGARTQPLLPRPSVPGSAARCVAEIFSAWCAPAAVGRTRRPTACRADPGGRGGERKHAVNAQSWESAGTSSTIASTGRARRQQERLWPRSRPRLRDAGRDRRDPHGTARRGASRGRAESHVGVDPGVGARARARQLDAASARTSPSSP